LRPRVEAARCWADGVTTDAPEADIGAHLGWAFPSWLGGPYATIDDIGLVNFVKRCDELCTSLGGRYTVPQSIRNGAAAGFRFHQASQ
jgi:3-hydroxyacyl-CoA dehydrogenase/enoyl-CoA hydratase/3-hydroxybutyryl-CoA epimerase